MKTTKAGRFKPLHDRVLVQRDKTEEVTPGGIIMPENAQRKSFEGTVLAVGKGVRLKDGTIRPLDVKKGDRVAFGRYKGSESRAMEAEMLILREDDLLGVFEE